MTKFSDSQKNYCAVLYLCIDSTIFIQTLCNKYTYYRNSYGIYCVQCREIVPLIFTKDSVYLRAQSRQCAMLPFQSSELGPPIPPPPYPLVLLLRPLGSKGGDTLACGLGGGGPDSDEETDILVFYGNLSLYTSEHCP
jgi:hypothetical protein